ncbi:MAG TPA: ABC transporter ATP-binding protein [Candidatus Coprovivens excrementavium]|nr:ABC transporter ATP-binding protein [Candidatus Coprovivens excrementavium]
MNKLVSVRHISKKYNTLQGEIEAIKDISFDINEGEFIAIVGTSGCGKSTLLSILAKLIKPSDGIVKYNIDNPVIGYMLQEDALFEHYNILDNVLLGLKIKKSLNKENREYVIDLLKKYKLENFMFKKPSELSGGMKQRVSLIRTLAIQPDILFLDEPFSALDFSTRLNVSDDVYKIIKDSGKTTIMVTHDIGEAISMADKVIVLSKCPSVVKNSYYIELDKKDCPTKNRKDKRFNYYYDLIWKDLDNNE